MKTNEIIINGIIKGQDRQVLDLLYEKLLPKLTNYITKNQGTIEDVSDLFQEVLIVIYKKVKQENFRPDHIINYMFVIGKNTWITQQKKNKKNTNIEVSNVQLEEESALETYISNEKNMASLRILNKLSDQCAKILNLRIFDGASLEEISLAINAKNKGVVKTMVYRCKQKLMAEISKDTELQELLGIKM